MKNKVAGAMVCALVLCTSCASIMPNTARTIAPATFTDLTVSIAADVEQWFQVALIFLGI